MSGPVIRVPANMQVVGGLQFALDSSGFPVNPQPGTIFLKDQCLYAYIKIGQLSTWYPFSNPTHAYIYDQTTAASQWLVTHNLGVPVSGLWVQAQDQNATLLFGTITPIDDNSFYLDFATPTVGSALIVAQNSVNVSEVTAAIGNFGGTVVANASGVTIGGYPVITTQTLNTSTLGAVPTSQLGAVNGVATLDSTGHLAYAQIPSNVATLDASGKLQLSQLPAVAITDTFVVPSEAAMLALTAQVGDVAVRTDIKESFILTVSDPSVLANWQELLHPLDSVASVNGMTGTVVISDITGNAGTATALKNPVTVALSGAISATGQFDGSGPLYLTTTYNGLSPVATSGAYADLTGAPLIPTKLSSLQNDLGFVASTALAAVATTGSYTDLVNTPAIPTKTSDLTNDSGFLTTAPVTMVNGRTGQVALDAASVGAVSVTTLGAVNGVATLDASGKLTPAQIPPSLLGGLVYQGTWDAQANTPALASGVGIKGEYFVVSVAGATSLDGLTQWNVGDMAVFNGTTWNKIDGVASEVLSVAGRTGVVVLTAADISGLATVSTSGAYADLTGKPTDVSAFTNDAGYQTAAQVSAAVSGGAYSLPQASTTVLGGVKVDGTTVTISAGGVISAAPGYTLPVATSTILGGVKQGTGVTIAGDGTINATPYSLPTASTTVLGGVKVDGTTVTISNGVISAAPGYTLPVATATVLGGVKQGSGVTIAADGTLNATPYSLPTASTTVLGGIKVDGTTITISNGVISAAAAYTLPVATATVLGGVKQGSGVTIAGDGTLNATPYTLPTASTSVLGGVQIDGTTITITNGVISAAQPAAYTLPTASTTTLGGVKIDGTSITIAAGVISATPYSLPQATTAVLGGVKVDGTTITVASGVISATPYSLPTASTTVLGGVKVDGSTITIAAGVLSATPYSLPTASTTVLGGVKVDGTTITIAGGVISAAGSGPSVTDDTTTAATYYPVFATSNSGAMTAKVASTKLTFNPSTGDFYAFNVVTSSDARLKTDVQTITNGLEIVDQLNPVSFTMKDGGTKSYGVIAQELEEVLPELVRTRPDTDMKSVSYDALVGVLLAAVKDLSAQVRELQAKV